MDLSILTGHGPSSLVGTHRALVEPAAVDRVGHRAPTDDSGRVEVARIDPLIRQATASQRLRGISVADFNPDLDPDGTRDAPSPR